MLNSKKYTFQIGGEQYVIVSDEVPEQLEQSVVQLDQLLRELSHGLAASSPQKAAVLAALRLQLELQAAQTELQQAQQTVERLIARLESAP